MNPWFYFLFYGAGWFVLGAVIVGSIINTIRQAEIRDLKSLLQGCGVIRQYPKRHFWSVRNWGIRAGQWLPRPAHRRRGNLPIRPRTTSYHSPTQIFKGGNYDRNN